MKELILVSFDEVLFNVFIVHNKVLNRKLIDKVMYSIEYSIPTLIFLSEKPIFQLWMRIHTVLFVCYILYILCDVLYFENDTVYSKISISISVLQYTWLNSENPKNLRFPLIS